MKRFSIWLLFGSLYFSIGPFFPYFGHLISHFLFKIGHLAFDLAILSNIVSTLFHSLVFVYNLDRFLSAIGHECEGDEGVDCAGKVEEPFPDGGGLEQVHAFD